MMEPHGAFRPGKAGKGPVAPCRILPPVCRRKRRPRLRPDDTNRPKPPRKNPPRLASDDRHLECRMPGCWRDYRACRGPGDGLPLQARGAATRAVSMEGLFSWEIPRVTIRKMQIDHKPAAAPALGGPGVIRRAANTASGPGGRSR